MRTRVSSDSTQRAQAAATTLAPAASPIVTSDPTATPNGVQREAQKEQAIYTAFLTPISIFGKVVDEQNRALAGATVQVSINDSPTRSGTEYVRSTDAEGLFSLVGVRGISFSLRASKEGFYTTKESTASRNVIAPASNDISAPSRENPVKLILRRKVQPEMLLHVTGRQVTIFPSGPTVIDLTTGKAGHGQLQILSVLGDANQSRFDWSYELSVPGGGLAERRGQFEFEAPADNYSESIQIAMTKDQTDWSSDVVKEYFARLPDGRFARFSINFYPGKRNFVVIESYVNPTPGNRNLEFGSEL